jgi:uncharacterized protein YlzI (FlbEa/FlbD family)
MGEMNWNSGNIETFEENPKTLETLAGKDLIVT